MYFSLDTPIYSIKFIFFDSEFGDIYDEDHFVATLDGYIKVVRELPDLLLERNDYNMTNIPTFRVQAWAPASYYMGEVYPVLREQGFVLSH